MIWYVTKQTAEATRGGDKQSGFRLNSSAVCARYIPSFVKTFVIKTIQIKISQYRLMIQLITAEIKQK